MSSADHCELKSIAACAIGGMYVGDLNPYSDSVRDVLTTYSPVVGMRCTLKRFGIGFTQEVVDGKLGL